MKNTQSNNKSSKPEAESEAVDPGGGQLAVYDGGFKIDNYIPYRLAQTQLMVNRAISPDAHPDLLAIQRFTQRDIRVLGMIGHHRSISPSGLAKRTGLDRATVTRTLSVLTDKKMIVVMRNAQDGRSKFIGLTRLGATYCETLFPIMKEYGEFLEEALEPEEKEALLKILKKLRIQAASRL